MKVVIPAAGLGTRFLPATKSMPKEMLPVLNRPVIQYVVEEAIAGGADDITIVTGRGKRAVEDHFDHNPDLGGSGAQASLRTLEQVMEKAAFHFVRQRAQRGLADAIACAEHHVGHEPFGVLLGDSIHVCDPPLLTQLRTTFEHFGGKSSVVALEKVPKEKVGSYGIAGGVPAGPHVIRIERLVEKPRVADAPGDTALTGAYYLTPAIFDAIRGTPPDAKGEVQLTDALVRLLATEGVYGLVFQGRRYDTGTPLLWLEANVRFALNDPLYRDRLTEIFLESTQSNSVSPDTGGPAP
ncbi:MAG: UTP--glucose-1-phosphate uridylyltransferase [Thermoplasmata archaeon]